MSRDEQARALLPCPFCKAPPFDTPQNGYVPSRTSPSGFMVYIWCDNCGVQGGERHTAEEAIAAWNTRTPDQPAENAKSSGVAAIAAERRRQVEQEGWTPEHDDEHSGSEMAAAAAAYAFSAATYERYFAADPMGFWPWDASWWKPKGPREDLVRAGALIAAEIDRLDRAALARSGKGEG